MRLSYAFTKLSDDYTDDKHVLHDILVDDDRWYEGDGPTYDFSDVQNCSNIKCYISGYDQLANKYWFAKNLQEFRQYIPETFLISNGIWIGKRPEKRKNTIWFIKDATVNGAEGIHLTRDPTDYNKNFAKINKLHVVQPHLTDIFLIDDRKFHLRMHLLFTFKSNEPFKCYLFKEGSIKKTAQPFNEDLSPENMFTNSCIQVGCDDYQHDMSFSAWEHYQVAFGNIKNALLEMSQVFSNVLHQSKETSGYWISGIDIMFDTKLNPWFLEFNKNPRMSPRTCSKKQYENFQALSVKQAMDLVLDSQADTEWEYLFTQV